MRASSLLLAALAVVFGASAASAAPAYKSATSTYAPRYSSETPTVGNTPVTVPTSSDRYEQPALLSFGAGWYDYTNNAEQKEALDARFEYRWGVSLLSAVAPSLRSWNRYIQFHPLAGIESSSRAQLFAFGGLDADLMIFQNLILTPSFAMGGYMHGDGKDLNSAFDFREQIELGYRFQNEVRTSVYYSHQSNAGLESPTPGANTVGVYLHVPVREIFGGR